jgi:Acyclic terpene utilisation family protein AtuA
MTKTVHIASGLGFYGDAWEPVVASLKAMRAGQPNYVASDHLAELTLAILQKDRQRDAILGYARDVVPMLMRLWPLMQERGVRFICNAGGLNPAGAAAAVQAAFAAKAWKARIAVVSGDDVLAALAEPAASQNFNHLFNDTDISTVRERLVFANAYLGARPIVDALAQGADIVITGRVADAALFLAPLVHEFAWKLEDASSADELNKLAQGLTVGHLLECSGQGSGGNFGSLQAWQAIPDLAHIGYPMAEVQENGSAVITKPPGSGGRVNFDTVRQQLLYEVHNPHAYASPDVVLDMSTIHLEDLGDDRVRVIGATGRARPDQLKVVAGYSDGYKAEVTWGYSWPDAYAKSQAALAMVKTQLTERRVPHDELFVEYPGLNSAHGALAPLPVAINELNEVWMRMVLRTQSKAAAEGFGRLFPWMGLSGPAYTCGFNGLRATGELLGIWPTLISREVVEAQVRIEWVEVGAQL